jgi:hypothetical protein
MAAWRQNMGATAMSDNLYNGWRNRETWLVNVWFAPTTRDDVEFIKENLQDEYDAMPNGALKDMCAFSEIDWDELKEAVDDKEDEEE